MRAPERFRIQVSGYPSRPGDLFGHFLIPAQYAPRKRPLVCQAVDAYPPSDWEHVSVSIVRPRDKAPLYPQWDEMEFVKQLFWHPDDTVLQFHPPRDKYANEPKAPHVLHLWRDPRNPIEAPDPILVARTLAKPRIKNDPRDREYLQEASEAIAGRLPDNHGFILLVTAIGVENPRLYYTSSLDRKDALAVIEEWRERNRDPKNWLRHQDD